MKTYVDALNEFLLKTHAVGQNNVLIIDEAQMLSVDVLEQLRLLTNLETNERKLLQIVLIGQPELRTMLERPELEQLAQRVIARFHLKALSSKETEHYIRHRLSVAGMTRSIPFDRKALQRIHEIARGVPRRINLLCDRAMLGAYAHGKTGIDSEVVEKAAREVFGKSEPNGPDRSRLGTGAGLGLFVATGLALTALLAFAIYGAYRKFAAPTPPVAAASAPRVAGAASPGSAGAASGVAPAASAARLASRRVPRSAAGGDERVEPGERAATGRRAARRASPPRRPPRSRRRRPPARPPRSPPMAPTAAGPTLGAAELKAQWTALGRDEKTAWRELAALWKVDPGSGEPCAGRRPPAGALLQVRDHAGDAEEPRSPRLPRPARRGRADDARGPDRPARRHRDPARRRPGAEGLGRRPGQALAGRVRHALAHAAGLHRRARRGRHRPAGRPARDPARRPGRRAGAAAAPDPGCGAARPRSSASRRRTA